MAATRKTWFAILGLLNWRPMSGYDIKKLTEIALAYFWSESYGQLYPTLDRLVAEGLATKKIDRQEGRRSRNVYRITAKGRRELERWLAGPSELPKMRSEFHLKFFLNSRRPVAENIALVEQYRVQLAARREEFADSERVLSAASRRGRLSPELEDVLGPASPDHGEEPLILFLTLRQGVRVLEARIDWCDEALRALRRKDKS